MQTESRQVRRARARANDYWQPNKYGKLVAPERPRTCRRESAAGRERASCKVIASKTPRKRLSPKPDPRFANGSKHAWQRKAAFWASMRAAIAQQEA